MAGGHDRREDFVFQRARAPVGNEFEDGRVHDIGADADLARLRRTRFLRESDDPERSSSRGRLGFDDAVGRRVGHRGQRESEGGAGGFVTLNECPDVEVGQGVAVEAHERLGKQRPHVSDGASRPERLRLHGIAEGNSERIAVAKGGLDPPGERGQAENDVGDPRLAKQVELGDEEGAVEEGDDGLGTAEGEGAQPERLPPDQNDRLHRTAGQDTPLGVPARC